MLSEHGGGSSVQYCQVQLYDRTSRSCTTADWSTGAPQTGTETGAGAGAEAGTEPDVDRISYSCSGPLTPISRKQEGATLPARAVSFYRCQRSPGF